MATRLFVFPTSWGWIGTAVSERGLAGLTLPRASEEMARALLQKNHPLGCWADDDPLPDLTRRLLDYLEGGYVDFSQVRLDLPATGAFRRRVWDLCAAIPYGETRTYAQLAAEAGSPRAFRAVGGAMASNPVPIVIPCHRVLGSNGSLVGFGGGVEQKRRMLDMEARASSSFPALRLP